MRTARETASLACFPALEPAAIAPTGEALHAYARVLGNWLKQCRPRRRHWWHASLRPALDGLTTGIVRTGRDFEVALDLHAGVMRMSAGRGRDASEPLRGQSARSLAISAREFLIASGVDPGLVPVSDSDHSCPDYAPEQARNIGRAFASVASVMEALRAGIREETSPIQLWPHHFDLSMVWLPGDKLPGQDPLSLEAAETADKQMNFGFTLGDDTIAEPYLYVTAYPPPDAPPALPLPEGAVWQTEGFTGVTLRYRRLMTTADPRRFLLDLWKDLLSAGRGHLQA